MRLMRKNTQIMRKVHGFTEQKYRYDKPDGDHDPHAASDLALTKRIAACLERHYPSHPWMIEVSGAQGVAYISLPIIMPRKQKYVLHISNLSVDPGLRTVVRAGGEILERHNVPRAGFEIDAFLRARDANPINRRLPRIIV